jgi:hypothetical protein
MRTLIALAGLLVGCLLPKNTSADPCQLKLNALGEPARLVMGPAGLGAVPESCPVTEAGLQGFGSALVAVNDFYGYVDGGLSAYLRYAFTKRDWFSFRFVPLEYRFSANATIEASRLGLGAGAIGYHHQTAVFRRFTLSTYARVLIPSDSAYRNAIEYGFDHGVSMSFLPKTWFAFTGGISLPSYFVVNGTRTYATFVPNLSLDAVWLPTRWMSLLLGTGIRTRCGRQSGFESLDPRAAIRFFLFRRLRIELGVATPLLGNDRTDLRLELDTAWLF